MRVIGPFEIGGVLARGGHAVVHEAAWSQAPDLALVAKVATSGHELQLHHENRMLRAIDHAHVITPTAFVDDAEHVALLLPRAACSLRAHEGRLDEPEVLHVATAIADALAAMHRFGLAHGDVTAGNILLLVDGTPLLADLGSARRCAEDAARTDVACLARAAIATLAPEHRGPVRALLDAVVVSPKPAAALADELRACGVEPRHPNALAAPPVVDEPPTMTIDP